MTKCRITIKYFFCYPTLRLKNLLNLFYPGYLGSDKMRGVFLVGVLFLCSTCDGMGASYSAFKRAFDSSVPELIKKDICSAEKNDYDRIVPSLLDKLQEKCNTAKDFEDLCGYAFIYTHHHKLAVKNFNKAYGKVLFLLYVAREVYSQKEFYVICRTSFLPTYARHGHVGVFPGLVRF